MKTQINELFELKTLFQIYYTCSLKCINKYKMDSKTYLILKSFCPFGNIIYINKAQKIHLNIALI